MVFSLRGLKIVRDHGNPPGPGLYPDARVNVRRRDDERGVDGGGEAMRLPVLQGVLPVERSRVPGDALAGLSQPVSGLAAIEPFCGKMPFQPVDTPDHCGMIDGKLPGSRGHRSAAHDGEHKTEVIPVDRTAALIQHFRTSMVQYIGLVS